MEPLPSEWKNDLWYCTGNQNVQIFHATKKAMQQKISALKSTLLKIACFPTANERENSLASVTDR